MEGDWKRAPAGFSGLVFEYPQMELYQVFRDRTANAVPSDWDGTFRHDSK